MNINLETILSLEFVGEEIDVFVTVLKKIHDAYEENHKIGFKATKKGKVIELTEDELTLLNQIYVNFKPVDQPEETKETNDTSD